MSSSSTDSGSDSDVKLPVVNTKSKKEKIHLKHSEPESDADDSSSAGDSDSSEEEDADAEAAEDDVPVKSHAEKRREKKKEQKAKPQSDETGRREVKNTAELAPAKLPKRQNSVWVGNLAFKTTAEALRRFFEGVGEITRIHMPMKLASAGPGGRGTVKENRGLVEPCVS